MWSLKPQGTVVPASGRNLRHQLAVRPFGMPLQNTEKVDVLNERPPQAIIMIRISCKYVDTHNHTQTFFCLHFYVRFAAWLGGPYFRTAPAGRLVVSEHRKTKAASKRQDEFELEVVVAAASSGRLHMHPKSRQVLSEKTKPSVEIHASANTHSCDMMALQWRLGLPSTVNHASSHGPAKVQDVCQQPGLIPAQSCWEEEVQDPGPASLD